MKFGEMCRSSQRLVYVFRSTDLSTSLNTLNLDVSPTLLIPYYDEDSSTVFLTGKVIRPVFISLEAQISFVLLCTG
jgi:hypothetical protein